MLIETCSECGKPLLHPIEVEAHEQVYHRECGTDDYSHYFEEGEE